MPRVVDGDNLLGSWPERSRSDSERRTLAREIAALARARRRRIVVVFDGIAPPGLHLGHDVLFSGQGRRADDVILDLLRREDDPRGWTVVTNDRSLADQCRYLEAAVERCDAFRSQLTSVSSSEKPDKPSDITEWLEIFGDDDDRGER
jgi:hypothetical protein